MAKLLESSLQAVRIREQAKDPVGIVKELRAAGIDRILWSNRAKPEEITAMNDLGVLTKVPERVAKFQVGERYRLPLWELVYHDCVVAQWYWGDYNNKLPALWAKRDLFNALYGTPPMFMFNRDSWKKNQDRFVQSYRHTCPVARATGYVEMTDHRFLTPDRSVQQTKFANGVTVTVNFGATPYRLNDGTTVPPTGIHTMGLK